jgi:hypothetical protein
MLGWRIFTMDYVMYLFLMILGGTFGYLFCMYKNSKSTSLIVTILKDNLATWQTKHEDLELDYTLLKDAIEDLREAQKVYMSNRGNEELGQKVAAAAFNVDNLLENIQ